MANTHISFNEIPDNIRVPGVYIEIDPSLASNAEDLQQILVIAPKGDAQADTVFPTTIPDDASDIFGADSVAHQMVTAIFDQTKALPINTIGVDSGGNGDDISAALAAIGDTQYHYIISAFNDEPNITRLADFLDERYDAMAQIPGIGFVGFKGTSAEVNAFSIQFNSPFISIMAINDLSVTIAQAVSAYYGQCAHSLAIDPARPLQTLQLRGVKTSANTEWTPTERNLMLYSGASTYTTNIAGDVFVERPITTYRENASGVADDSYLDVMTVATAIYFRAKQRSRILSRYPRHKLAKDGTNFAPGQSVLTPKLFKAAMFGLYRDLEEAGIVQDFANYKETFICSIDPNNPTRINYQDQPMFVNGLIIVAGKIQFRKN